MQVAHGGLVDLNSYCRFNVRCCGKDIVIDAYLVPEGTSFSLLLGRGWMKKMGLRGDYAKDTYYVPSPDKKT